MKLEGASATDVGRIRDINQDRVFFAGQVAAVADGMGGHAGGERAAEVAIEQLEALTASNPAELLLDVVAAANERVFEVSIEEGLQGMGTTMVALALNAQQGLVRVVNVGDSRGYLFRGGQLSQVTVDHSLVQDLVTSGQLTEEDALSHPQRNIVTRALGIDTSTGADTFDIATQNGDLFLLCSDGLSNEVTDAGIAELLSGQEEFDDLQGLADELVRVASDNGGRDNISVALARVVAEDGDTFDPLDLDQFLISDFDAGLADDPGSSESTLETESAVVIDTEAIVDATADAVPDAEGLDLTNAGSAARSEVIDVASSEVGGERLADGGASTLGPGAAQAAGRSRKGRLVMFFVLVAILAVAFGSANWYGRNAWFADTSSGQVVIQQGRPGGFLWIAPEQIEATDLLVTDLDNEARSRLDATPTWPSLTAAREFTDSLAPSGADPAITEPDVSDPDSGN